MVCSRCNREIKGDLKYLAYYSNGKPVYWKLCDSCIKKGWISYRDTYLKEIDYGRRHEST